MHKESISKKCYSAKGSICKKKVLPKSVTVPKAVYAKRKCYQTVLSKVKQQGRQ
jgi:hypothetical protein